MFRIAALSVLLFGILASSASADVLCAKKKVKVVGGRVNLANNLTIEADGSCPTSHSLIKDFGTINDPQVAAFARINQAAEVLSFGGTGVTAVSSTQSIATYTQWDVTFTGNFEGLSDTDSADNQNRFTVLTTAASNSFGVTNAFITAATATEVTVRVFIWKSDDLSNGYQSGIFVALLQGELPAS
ncbi:MAG: hypothetical protein QY326_08365 [Bdellovibrionota bacterium]|nr:MAG: hypothetical protein QY326_08365 [Bdellovibrionota bacterium]